LCNGIDRTSLNFRSMVVRRSSIWANARGCGYRYNNRGDALCRKKGTTTAPFRISSNRSKLNPANAKSFNNSGVAYLKKGELDVAIKNLDEAIRLNPNYAKASSTVPKLSRKRTNTIARPATMTRRFVLSPIRKSRGTDAAGPAPSW